MIHCNNDGGCGMVGYGKCCGACEGKLVLFSYRLGQEQRTQSDGAFEMKTCYEVLIQAQLWNYSCTAFCHETHQIPPPAKSSVRKKYDKIPPILPAFYINIIYKLQYS